MLYTLSLGYRVIIEYLVTHVAINHIAKLRLVFTSLGYFSSAPVPNLVRCLYHLPQRFHRSSAIVPFVREIPPDERSSQRFRLLQFECLGGGDGNAFHDLPDILRSDATPDSVTDQVRFGSRICRSYSRNLLRADYDVGRHTVIEGAFSRMRMQIIHALWLVQSVLRAVRKGILEKHRGTGLLKEESNTILSFFFIVKVRFHSPGEWSEIDTDNVFLEDLTARNRL